MAGLTVLLQFTHTECSWLHRKAATNPNYCSTLGLVTGVNSVGVRVAMQLLPSLLYFVSDHFRLEVACPQQLHNASLAPDTYTDIYTDIYPDTYTDIYTDIYTDTEIYLGPGVTTIRSRGQQEEGEIVYADQVQLLSDYLLTMYTKTTIISKDILR